MEGFRFILENPHPNATNSKQRKRARLVTACDSWCVLLAPPHLQLNSHLAESRVKKIKCQQTTPNSRCEACKTAKSPCLFGDRDRYQAERGVTCTWSTPIDEIPQSPDDSRRRKLPGGSSTQFQLIHSFPGVDGPSRSVSPNIHYLNNYSYAQFFNLPFRKLIQIPDTTLRNPRPDPHISASLTCIPLRRK